MVCVFLLGSSFYYFCLLPPVAFHIEILQHPDEHIGQGDVFETSIALDSNDYPHISYAVIFGWSSLYIYASYNGSSWVFETLHPTNWGVVGGITFDLDPNDNPHIIYVISDCIAASYCYHGIKYAYFNGSSWSTQTAYSTEDPQIRSISAPSIGVDSQGNPHICYYRACKYGTLWNGTLEYAYKNGTSWATQTVDHEYFSHLSIALDSHDKPHVTYNTEGSLKYAYYNGASWNIEIVDSSVGGLVSIALDSQNKPHMIYGYEELKYAYLDGGLWNIQTVPDTIEDHVYYNSMALDSEDNPHIRYSSGDALRYAYYDGTSWSVKTVLSDAVAGHCNSIALDSHGYPHFSFGGNHIRYAYLAVRPPFIETPLGKALIYAAPITAVAILTLFILKKKYNARKEYMALFI